MIRGPTGASMVTSVTMIPRCRFSRTISQSNFNCIVSVALGCPGAGNLSINHSVHCHLRQIAGRQDHLEFLPGVATFAGAGVEPTFTFGAGALVVRSTGKSAPAR